MTFEESLEETIRTLRDLGKIRTPIEEARRRVIETLHGGGKLLICGNGGSAAEAQHFATELAGRYKSARRSLPAIALNADGTLMSCIANDFGWEKVFGRQLAGLARPGDLLVCFSSSGNSPPILEVLREAQRLGLPSLAFLGKGGGAAGGMASCEVIVPSQETAAVQEAHLFLIHQLCESLEDF